MQFIVQGLHTLVIEGMSESYRIHGQVFTKILKNVPKTALCYCLDSLIIVICSSTLISSYLSLPLITKSFVKLMFLEVPK